MYSILSERNVTSLRAKEGEKTKKEQQEMVFAAAASNNATGPASRAPPTTTAHKTKNKTTRAP